jgi:hypothetical protein
MGGTKFMAENTSDIVLCTYRVKQGKENDLLKLIAINWQTLNKLGLVAAAPQCVYRGKDKGEKTFFVELLAWKDAGAPNKARQVPEAMKIWEQSEQMCESRNGCPACEFLHVEPVEP